MGRTTFTVVDVSNEVDRRELPFWRINLKESILCLVADDNRRDGRGESD